MTSSAGRASRLHRECQGFESLVTHNNHKTVSTLRFKKTTKYFNGNHVVQAYSYILLINKKTMPQLYTITYLSQLFWTFIVFAVFYLMMVNHILPAISTSIKVRKKKLASIGSLSSDLGDEQIATVSQFETILGASLGSSRESLVKVVDESSEWQSESTKTVLTESDANATYLKTQGSIVGRVSLTNSLTKDANWDDKAW